MKRLIYTITVLLSSQFAFAQVSSPCGTDQMHKQFIEQNPQAQQQYAQYNEAFVQYLKTVDLNQFKTNGTSGKTSSQHYIIPVVFHVLHNNGSENIPDQKIIDEIKIMNMNYSASSPFRNRIRDIFKDIEADVNIEFRLARIAPNGDTTNGIDRVYVGPLTSKGNDNQKMNTWDTQKYLNIWVCNSIRINSAFAVGGYAYKPGTGVAAAVDGPIVLASTIGNISSPNPFDYNTAGHEVGHYLGLDHPFNGDSCALDGDFIYDTPPRYFTPGVGAFNGVSTQNFCANPDSNTCNTDNPDFPDQTENFMDYFSGDCSNSMFTLQQAARMHFTLENYRRNLWQPATLIATGTADITPTYLALMDAGMTPKPDFSILNNQNLTDRRACVNSPVAFRDNSTNYKGTPTYSWNFGDGASPATSTAAIPPAVTYTTPGYKTITLTVTSNGKSATKVATDYIYIEGSNDVKPQAGVARADWDYTNNFLAEGWHFENESPSGRWQRTTNAAYDEIASIVLPSNNTVSGFNYSIISPPFNFTGATAPYLEFYYAFAANLGPTQDALSVHISTDCGKTWSTPKVKVGGNAYEANVIPLNPFPPAPSTINQLGTTPSATASPVPVMSTSDFYPSGAAQWRKMTVPSAQIPTQANVKFKILFSCGGGNNLYIDNLMLGLKTGINEVSASDFKAGIHPNPFTGSTILSYTMPLKAKVDVRVYDIVGKEIGVVFTGMQEMGTQELTIDRSKLNLNSGLYFVKMIIDDSKELTQKIVIN